MLFDPQTLMMMTVIICVTIGLMLLFSWVQNREYRSLAWWGAGNFISGVAATLFMLGGIAPDFLTVNIANALLAGGCASIWAGGRAFSERRILWEWMAAGPVLWLAACMIPQFYDSEQLRVLLMSIIIAGYTLAAARELWFDEGEHLISRYPAVGWLLLHALFYIGRAGATFSWAIPASSELGQIPWFAIFVFEALINAIVVGFLVLSMAKERSECIQRRAASIDELTGAASRRAFLSKGEERLCLAANDRRQAALLLLDLDHFKTVNDNFGHPAGDRVLSAFSRKVMEVIRPSDLFGRIGGEEFAVLMTELDDDAALEIADRLRRAVHEIEFEDLGLRSLSVSVGIATTSGGSCNLGELMKQADHALYGAKSAGRDCVKQRSLHPSPRLQVV
jgi:diguanylate cyclase (GGDEF)-like protein